MTASYDDSEQTDHTESATTAEVDRETVFETVDPGTLETVVKLLLGIGALLFLLGIVSVLPGLDRVIPSTPITVTALAVALVTVAILAVLAYAAPHVETLVEQAVAKNDPLAPKAGTIAKYLVILAAVLVAYHGFARAIVPFLAPDNVVWLYDVAFLTLALVPTALIGLTLYRALDPAAEQLTELLTSAATVDEDGELSATDEESDRTTDDTETSPQTADTEKVTTMDSRDTSTEDDSPMSTDETTDETE